jgi:uncharacterized protein YndB with AHSA1/START domain
MASGTRSATRWLRTTVEVAAETRNRYVAHMSTPATPQDTGFELARIERSVRIEAPLDEVWRSLTEPAELATWLGGEVDLDRPLAPGAAGRVLEADGSVRHLLVTGHEPGHQLRWHWWHEGASRDDRDAADEGLDEPTDDGVLSSVEITVVPEGDATVVRVVEVVARAGASAAAGPCSTDAALVAIDRNWDGALSALAARLTGARPAAVRA